MKMEIGELKEKNGKPLVCILHSLLKSEGDINLVYTTLNGSLVFIRLALLSNEVL